MAILDKETLLQRLNERTQNDTSDEMLMFIEDMTDTLNDMSAKAENSGGEWEQKYNELDASWKKKYRDRFFNTPAQEPEKPKDEPQDNSETITIKDLFKMKER